MRRNVCILISLLDYTLFTSTHTLHCVGQDIPFGSELQNHVPPQESARVQHTNTLRAAPQPTSFTDCLGNRFTNRWKHEKNKNPKLWHIEISHSTYSFHLPRLTHIINTASYQSCLQFLRLMMHISLFLQQLSCTHWNAFQNISEVKVK